MILVVQNISTSKVNYCLEKYKIISHLEKMKKKSLNNVSRTLKLFFIDNRLKIFFRGFVKKSSKFKKIQIIFRKIEL